MAQLAHRRSSGIISLAFNQEQDCFACCLKTGLRIYNVEPLVEISHFNREEVGEVLLCEMIDRTNWLLYVSARRPNILMAFNAREHYLIAEVSFKAPIRAIKARKDKVAIVLSSTIQVLAIPKLNRVALMRIPAGCRPLCTIATDAAVPQLLAAPAHRKGCVQIIDVSRVVRGAHSSSPAVMNCHQNDLVCMSLSPNGTRLATASEKGTIIRVFDTGTRTPLHELRRGSDYADVFCINFNATGTLVSCVSDKGTMHVWSARGAWTHLAAAKAFPDTRAQCGFINDNTAVMICEDGSYHKFSFASEGNCHRTDFDVFLQVGDDNELLL
ncbi:WD repeat domain phosphoinositide-interacting protein 4 [Spodoptera frugiperda]|uniref:SFRICE_008414 n=1 Tax=Spodoptera frugiperda TaxID=7108 RepID=A0A2H1VAV9_SPOFR|nr:WD repeat domain phosphoinositide-interacting protein 4 [Spodoptera frugiperda]